MIRSFFWDTWLSLDHPQALPRYRLWIALAVVCGAVAAEQGVWAAVAAQGWVQPEDRGSSLAVGAAAAGIQLLLYVLMPALVLKHACGMDRSALGLAWGSTSRQLPWLAGAYALSLLVIVPASFSPQFQALYPASAAARRGWGEFIAAEALVAAGLLSVEVLFRGLILRIFAIEFGRWGPLAATLPYCLLHLGKHPLEALAALAYSLILDTLAIRTGSVAGGWLVHAGMALTLDLLCRLQLGL